MPLAAPPEPLWTADAKEPHPWAIARWDNPRSWLRRKTSRIFLTGSLRAGLASPSPRRTKRAPIRLPTSVHRDRISCSTSPDPAFNFPDSVFVFRRLRPSRSSGLRIRAQRGDRRQPVRHTRRPLAAASFGRLPECSQTDTPSARLRLPKAHVPMQGGQVLTDCRNWRSPFCGHRVLFSCHFQGRTLSSRLSDSQ